ncbi:MAG: type I 3-dehydroquinate dehydratase [Chlamydiales bacterium]|nr:type I 3-dehydroquinate dehydratase [Chlamydiales bacterium]
MLVGVVLGKVIEDILQQIEELKGKVDLAEVRLDYLDESAWPKMALLKEKAHLPLLFTFRKKEQGGRFALEERKRLALYEEALSLQPAYADIEADTDFACIQKIKNLCPQTNLIGSFHDMEKTPEDLSALLKSMYNPHFSLYKIAVQANSTVDLMRLMVFAREMTKTVPLSCISLGPYGGPSRVLGPIVGNVLNYTSFQDALSSLYQYSLDTLQNLYGFSHLSKETKIYALLGNPVEASQGHFFHNECFRRENIHAIYIKLRLASSELKSFFSLSIWQVSE